MRSFCFSYACLIDEGDTFLLVGGFQQENRVSRYNIDGWLENLDDLNTGRFNHGCTQYQEHLFKDWILDLNRHAQIAK